MSLFKWFLGKPESAKSTVLANPAGKAAPGIAPTGTAPAAPARPSNLVAPRNATKPAPDPTNRSEERKAKRHGRREQLYIAVRESMTRSGVLSSSYKFKVLSLDQKGDQFLVMMDVHPTLGGQAEKMSESEAVIVQTAKILFGITVTSVYWRLDIKAEQNGLKHSGFESRPTPPEASLPISPSVKKVPSQRFEPIQDDEVNAFKQALMAASAQHPGQLETSGKTRSGLRSFTLITGFEDTEMPESNAAPALSATQYGDLQ